MAASRSGFKEHGVSLQAGERHLIDVAALSAGANAIATFEVVPTQAALVDATTAAEFAAAGF